MKIELKNIHFSEHLSEETYAFTASLYINGFKAGMVINHGYGGNTNFHSMSDKGRKLIKEAEKYCRNLPSEKYTSEGVKYNVPMDLKMYVDILLEDHLRQKELQKFHKKIEKLSDNYLIIGIPDRSFRTLRLRFPINLMLVHSKSKNILADIIRERVLPHLKENEKVLNDNIPKKIYEKGGLSPSQYLKSSSDINPSLRKKPIKRNRKGKSHK